jgi:hypothetical protein
LNLPVPVSYPPEFVESLAGFGLAPAPSTPPSLVRDAVNDLYRYQLRALRDQLRAGLVEPGSYHGLVVALRKRYWVLTLPLAAWERICGEGSEADGGASR